MCSPPVESQPRLPGRGLLARTLHKEGSRWEGPFITVNCGAIPENLIESELFGYVAGAFTGSRSGGKRGYFEAAQNGTIFLDEISTAFPDTVFSQPLPFSTYSCLK